jgi:FkbM family methyltransferase
MLDGWREDLDWLDGRLADDASRETLVRLLAHRLVGGRRVALGVGRATSEQLSHFAATALAAEPRPDDPPGYPRYDLRAIGIDLSILSAPMFLIHTFLLEQYRHPDLEEANPRDGDVAVDGGAFSGDTSLWLAEQVGPRGRVIAFEPDPDSRRILDRNLRENPEHGGRVEVRAQALWDSETAVELTQQWAASTVDAKERGGVQAVSLDALGAVDFVKLDVEGAELRVIRGAEQLIRSRPPRFAVAVYHRPEDVVAVPRMLARIEPSYSFALTHRSLHQFDTMLFAWPERRVN